MEKDKSSPAKPNASDNESAGSPLSTSDKKPAIVKKDSKVRKSAVKLKRNFPQYSIEEARRIPDVIKQFNMGNPWAPKDIADALNMGFGDNFFYLSQSARDYGFTSGTKASIKIELTELGRALVYPKSQEEGRNAITSAFKNIDLLKKLHDYYQGQNLPEIQYLKNTLKTEFGVPEDYQDDLYTLYQKNLIYMNDQGALLPETNLLASGGNSTITLGEPNGASKLKAFVAMPFSEKTPTYPAGYFDEVLKHLITPAAVKANFSVQTAKKASSDVIQSTIVNDLGSADLLIVDLTEHNPNVLFELGMRIAFNKPVCLIRAKGTTAIFDIDHMLRVFDYNSNLWPSTLAHDVPSLSDFISGTWENRDKDRSYLDILRENK